MKKKTLLHGNANNVRYITDEDGCMTIYVVVQGLDFVQKHVAQCLHVPYYKVHIITCLLGGAFGGKIIQTTKVVMSKIIFKIVHLLEIQESVCKLT